MYTRLGSTVLTRWGVESSDLLSQRRLNPERWGRVTCSLGGSGFKLADALTARIAASRAFVSLPGLQARRHRTRVRDVRDGARDREDRERRERRTIASSSDRSFTR